MANTIIHKIIARAAGRENVESGEIVTASVDFAFAHDSSGPRRWQPLMDRVGVGLWDPSRVAIVTDHYVPAVDADSAQILQSTREFAARHGIESFFDMVGIAHVVLAENGLIRPGAFVAGGDSHSPHGGAFGAYVAGYGATDMFGIVATGETWLKVPKVVKVELNGTLPDTVVAKDLMLFLCRELGLDNAFTAFEFAGSAVDSMSMYERMVLSNMTTELGGEAGIIAPDATTLSFMAERGKAVEDEEAALVLASAPDAEYSAVHSFDVGQLSAQVTLDVGGTSTDVALIEGLEARRVRTTDVGHLSVRASALDVKTVGAGGGSIAHVPDLTKALRVGPESAGAVPGPVAYGKGGQQPTVTDANVVLGYLPEDLLGGSFKLDREGAERAVQTIADALGVGLMEAARGIIDIVNENMFGALRMISVQQGYDPREFALMGFGGAGPLHVNAVAKLMGSWPAVSPVSPGVLCALGDATTRMRTETARSFSKLARDTSVADLVTVLDEMAAQTRSELLADGVPESQITTQFEVDVRYAGQAFEVPLTINKNLLDRHGIEGLLARFDEEHLRLFTFNMETPHEIVNLRAVALGEAPALPAAELPTGDGDPSAAKIRDHTVWMDGREQAAIIYDRAKLRQGDTIPGPAIITEMDSTTLVESGCTATLDAVGNILINPAKEG